MAWRESRITHPAVDFAPVTPSDSQPLEKLASGLSWATDGDITILTPAGKIRKLSAGSLMSKTIWPIQARAVKATGTTATGIVAYFHE